jgi:hypothetical protein
MAPAMYDAMVARGFEPMDAKAVRKAKARA